MHNDPSEPEQAAEAREAHRSCDLRVSLNNFQFEDQKHSLRHIEMLHNVLAQFTMNIAQTANNALQMDFFQPADKTKIVMVFALFSQLLTKENSARIVLKCVAEKFLELLIL